MSYRDLQPLPSDIAALLAAERRAPRPPVAREDAILSATLARVEAAVGVVAATSAAAAQASGRAAGLAGGAAAKGLVAAVPASKVLLATVALVVGGAGAATSTYLALRPPARPPAIVSPVEAPGKPAPSRAPSPRAALALPGGSEPLAPEPSATPVEIAAPPVGRSARAAAEDLTAESALLEHARRELDRGAPEAALADVRRHAHLFARGHLVEEREALWIKALAASGQASAARARATSFQKLFPHSIQQDAVDRALREIP